MNRIDQKFRELKKKKKKAFIAFITAGYPNLETTYRLVLALAKSGVDIIELGVPFSDPMADGPVIQEASAFALNKGINLRKILNLVKRLRRITDIPLCLMTYYNPVFCFGEREFVREACRLGVDGLIVPDLPPEEAGCLITLSKKYPLDMIFFISPTTSRIRAKFISRMSRGFIYYLSLTGVTGPRRHLAPDLIRNLKRLKKVVQRPLCVGFGVSNRRQVKEIQKVSSGVIVGSAIVAKIKENLKHPDLVKKVGRFVWGLAK